MGVLFKPYKDHPRHGKALEISPGVFWLALPLPYPPGYVNVWLIDEGNSWTLIDTGMDTSLVRKTWEALFENILEGRPISRLICTHSHEDHMGLAGWLQEKYAATLWTTKAEWAFGRQYNGKGWGVDATDFFVAAGTGRKIAAEVNKIHHPYGEKSVPIPLEYTCVKEGDTISIADKNWLAMTGFGHSKEHLCLYNSELNMLISGDIILPEICPVLCVFPNDPEENPIKDYLDALPKFAELPEDTLVLPAHGLPFKGLHQRITSTTEYNNKNLDKVFTACDKPISAGALVLKLYPNRTHPKNQFLALSETIARLNYLRSDGKMTRKKSENIWLYQKT